ncbi:MAG: hypothetical protein AAGE43_11580 [Pseudomonadota bacterium]
MQMTFSKLIAAAVLTATFAIGSAAPAQAAPTVQVAGGATVVKLDTGFLDALEMLNVDLSAQRPGWVFGRFGVFRIPAGALDAGTNAGDIFHTGGLGLTAGTTTVTLLNFIIDTTSLVADEPRPILTGIVVVNGDTVGRVPLFDLALNQAPSIKGRKISISHVDVTLSEEAAGALNGIFGVDAFMAGLPIGTARVNTRILRSH